MTRVSVGGRLHFGFLNLALSRERLYGGLGVALAEPRVSVTAAPADGIHCTDPPTQSTANTPTPASTSRVRSICWTCRVRR